MTDVNTLVEVVWEDAVGDSGVHSLEGAAELRPIMQYSVGYLLVQDNERIVVGRDWYEVDGAIMVQNPLAIPAGWIKEVRSLQYTVAQNAVITLDISASAVKGGEKNDQS